MARKTSPLLPTTERLLQALGERLRLARLRRRMPAKQVAQRAGMTDKTLRALERGMPGITMGAYAAVLQALQLEKDLDLVAKDDTLGRQLQDKALEGRFTARRMRGVVSPSAAPAPVTTTPSRREKVPAEPGTGVSSDALLALLETPSTTPASGSVGRRGKSLRRKG